MIDIKMNIKTKLNRNGNPYKVLSLYFYDNKIKDYVKFYDIYIKSALAQVLEYIQNQ